MLHSPKSFFITLILVVMGFQSCAYYNTFYNAEQYFEEAQKLTRDNQLETLTREEAQLYSKAIEKSRKLLNKYPDSKYTDDAQFLIAKSYYFKGEYSTAQRYFEDMTIKYGFSEFAAEVPLWIGRCLVKLGDMEMARHEASRILRSDADNALQAEALLLMGEVAIQQDSMALAESYLEQVIDLSPDGFTKAQAQYQVGRMRENQQDYQGALEAYQSISKHKPTESLKVEGIIRQTSMLKALGQDEKAVEMIRDMLLSEKFVDIRGQLEVELGKLYITLEQYERAQTTLSAVVENYARQEVAAEASFMLGELYLTKQLKYAEAHKAYSEVRVQSSRSPLVSKAAAKIKLVDKYKKVQMDILNLDRQLTGLPPIVIKSNTVRPRARNTRSRGRSRGDEIELQAEEQALQVALAEKKSAPVDTAEVSAEDSVRFLASKGENQYKLAEYMLFEFGRVDTSLEILRDLEQSSTDETVKQQSAYMQYYALSAVRGDEAASRQLAAHIEEAYPEYYKKVMGGPDQETAEREKDFEAFNQLALNFEQGQYREASRGYQALKDDESAPAEVRSKACFKYAWLNDHYLYNKAAAIAAYEEMLEKYPDDPLSLTAQNRLDVLGLDEPVSAGQVDENGTQ